VLVWLPPLVQQITGSPGNLGEIVDYFRHPTEKMLGFGTGFGLMGKELGLPGPWVTGNDASPLGFVFTAGTGTALVLLAAALILGGLAWRWGSSSATRLACLVVATAWFGVLAGARITVVPGPYLLRWWWVIAALLWSSLAWSLWSVVGEARLASTAVPVGSVAIVILAAVVGWDAVPVRVPNPGYSRTIGTLMTGTVGQLARDRRYLVTWNNADAFGAVGVGSYLDLSDRGFDVRVAPVFGRLFGSWRVARPEEVEGTITVVSSDQFDRVGFQPPAGSVPTARYDPLRAADRQRAQELERDIRSHTGPSGPLEPDGVDSFLGKRALLQAGVDPARIEALRALRQPGLAYAVYVVPPPP
jgi:hypothetical protein